MYRHARSAEHKIYDVYLCTTEQYCCLYCILIGIWQNMISLSKNLHDYKLWQQCSCRFIPIPTWLEYRLELHLNLCCTICTIFLTAVAVAPVGHTLPECGANLMFCVFCVRSAAANRKQKAKVTFFMSWKTTRCFISSCYSFPGYDIQSGWWVTLLWRCMCVCMCALPSPSVYYNIYCEI